MLDDPGRFESAMSWPPGSIPMRTIRKSRIECQQRSRPPTRIPDFNLRRHLHRTGALANVGYDLQKDAYVMQSTDAAHETEVRASL
jgi:hypothetical protein